MSFDALEPGIEVNGATTLAIVDGFKFYKRVAMEILAEHDIAAKDEEGNLFVDPDGWYSQQAWLNAFFEIKSKLGDSVLFQIGQKIPDNAIFPAWIADINDAIRAVNIAYHMNHRKDGEVMYSPDTNEILEGIGNYGCQRIKGENTIISVCDTPYPCAFDHGILTSMGRRYSKTSYVEHVTIAPCRDAGGENCTYKITW